MAPKTLCGVVSPICSKLKIFGFNFSSEKPEGCSWKMYKLLVSCVFVYQMWKILIKECSTKDSYSAGHIPFLIGNLLLMAGVSMYFFVVDKKEMKKLIMRIKQQRPLGKRSEKSLNKQLIPFKIFTTLFAMYFFVATLVLGGYFMSYLNLHLENLAMFCRFFLTFVYLESSIFTLQIPTLICILPCIVACYCRAEVDEAIEEMKRFKSPWRRAKASSKLIEKYHRLYQLASDTDRALSAAMGLIKWPFLITVAVSQIVVVDLLTHHPKQVGVLAVLPFLNYVPILISVLAILIYFPLLQYFYLASSANEMANQMNRAMVEFVSIDDERVSRDPNSRPYLLKMRMKQQDELSLVALDQPPFTLFGEVMDSDISYMIILEIIDMWNTLGVHEANEEIVISRLFYNFMSRCIDCANLNYYT